MPASPPAAPAAPPPAAPQVPTGEPNRTAQVVNPEDDPNLQMQRLISRRKDAPDATPPIAPPAAPGTQPPPATPAPPAESADKNLTSLMGKALKFTERAPKPGDAPAAPPAAPAAPAPAAPSAAAPTPEPAPAPTKVNKRKPAPAIDPAAIASAAATAATEAVLKASGRKEPEKAEDPAEGLRPDDKHEYEVVTHMASIDPRYKDGPKIVLEQVAKAEAYAAKWEADHPGKQFDPDDEEHDAFFASQKRPWSDSEFRNAEVDLRAEEKLRKQDAKYDKKLEAITEQGAKLELASTVDAAVVRTAGTLAKLMGDDVHEAAVKGGLDALMKKDPIEANVISATLEQLHPFVEACIQIDDPQARIKLDPKNPVHQQWNAVVAEGEARCVGQVMNGKTFARRADYVRMNEAERARHWYLTSDLIIQGAVEYAASQAKQAVVAEKKRLEALGYTRAAPAAPPQSVTPPSQPAAPPPPVAVPAPAEKPVSPSAGGGPRIDDTTTPPKTGSAALTDALSNILFRRG